MKRRRRAMSEATKEKLRVAYRARVTGEEKELPNEEEGSGLHGVERMRVAKVCINTRLVEADWEVGGARERVLVDVGRNLNFAIGDEIFVRKHVEAFDLWQLTGMVNEELPLDSLGLPRDKRRPYRG
jgi:hypothetical protein